MQKECNGHDVIKYADMEASKISVIHAWGHGLYTVTNQKIATSMEVEHLFGMCKVYVSTRIIIIQSCMRERSIRGRRKEKE